MAPCWTYLISLGVGIPFLLFLLVKGHLRPDRWHRGLLLLIFVEMVLLIGGLWFDLCALGGVVLLGLTLIALPFMPESWLGLEMDDEEKATVPITSAAEEVPSDPHEGVEEEGTNVDADPD